MTKAERRFMRLVREELSGAFGEDLGDWLACTEEQLWEHFASCETVAEAISLADEQGFNADRIAER